MINSLTKLALIDGLWIIRGDESFFGLSTKSRKSKFTESYSNLYPSKVIDYFAETTERDLVSEIKSILKDLESKLSEIITKYISKELGPIIDTFDSKISDIDKNNFQLSRFGKEIVDLIERSTYNEINEKLSREIYKKTNGNMIIVESPIGLDTKLKLKIRNTYKKSFDVNFVVFKINENILGGMKTYINGKIIDNSWSKKIEKLEYIGA